MRENWKFNMKKDNKKAMVAAWSDNKSSESENDKEHTANVCLMTKEVQDDKETEYKSSYEVDVYGLYEYSKEELIEALISFAN